MDSLPPEIVCEIFSFLDVFDLAGVARVCRSWKDWSRRDCMWRRHVDRLPDGDYSWSTANLMWMASAGDYSVAFLRQGVQWEAYRAFVLKFAATWALHIRVANNKVQKLRDENVRNNRGKCRVLKDPKCALKGRTCRHIVRMWDEKSGLPVPIAEKRDMRFSVMAKKIRLAHMRNGGERGMRCRLHKEL